MNKSWWGLVLVLSLSTWLLAGIYGLIFNPTYVDEAKYLIKGWLIFNGQIRYYLTENFIYQHMPGSLLWFGLGQKLFGPSLLIGRLQSLFIGLLAFWGSYALGKRLGKNGGIITLALLSLAPVTALYYSSSVPQSMAVLMLLLGFIFLFDGYVKKSQPKFLLASVFFSLAFIVRENFLFTLILYLGFLLFFYKNDFKSLFKHLLVITITLGIFILPGYPGTVNVLKNFPGVSQLLPVSQAEKGVLDLYWKGGLQAPGLKLRAIREFGEIFHAWILIGGMMVIHWLQTRSRGLKITRTPINLFLIFLALVICFNFAAHTWAAFQLSPRAIVSYFSYVTPLLAVLMAYGLIPLLKNKTRQRLILTGYLSLLLLWPVGVRFARIFEIPTRNPDLLTTFESAKKLQPLIANKDKILWLSEPMSLYLAGRISYYPLIHHTGFYKESIDTQTVKRLGFWNKEMLTGWLQEANLVVIEDNKMNLLKEVPEGKNLAAYIETELNQNFDLIEKRDDIWPGGLSFYRPN